MPDSFFTRDGATIAYRYTGSGSPLGHAHGVFLSRDAVRRLGLFDFDLLGSGRGLLTYDQRGRGESTGRPEVADYTFDNVGADLLGLLDAAGIDEPIDFAGSSYGVAAAAGGGHGTRAVPPARAADPAGGLGDRP